MARSITKKVTDDRERSVVTTVTSTVDPQPLCEAVQRLDFAHDESQHHRVVVDGPDVGADEDPGRVYAVTVTDVGPPPRPLGSGLRPV
jgi:hypothetical protein